MSFITTRIAVFGLDYRDSLVVSVFYSLKNTSTGPDELSVQDMLLIVRKGAYQKLKYFCIDSTYPAPALTRVPGDTCTYAHSNAGVYSICTYANPPMFASSGSAGI
jgi:hypothetical protein